MVDFAALTRFIKICGVTSVPDAQLVLDAGATAVGIILAPSPRQVSLAVASAITQRVADDLVRVGVFRDNDDDFVARAVRTAHFDAVQIHGPLSDGLCEHLTRRGVAVIKALAIGSGEFDTFDDSMVDAILIDGPVPGSGVTHPWSELHRRSWTRPIIAAGGLNPQNVDNVLTLTQAWGCDVATGVESSPGVKSAAKVLEFVTITQRHFDNRKERHD